MLAYATKQDTVDTLLSLGFKQVPGDEDFFDSPKNDGYNIPTVQAFIYLSSAGYYCVDLDGGFRAPCVWKGPKAVWDKTDTTEEFLKFLNSNFPRWN